MLYDYRGSFGNPPTLYHSQVAGKPATAVTRSLRQQPFSLKQNQQLTLTVRMIGAHVHEWAASSWRDDYDDCQAVGCGSQRKQDS